MTPAIRRLQDALVEQDSFETNLPDDAPVFVEHENCYYEFNGSDRFFGVRLTLGHLREIVAEALSTQD